MDEKTINEKHQYILSLVQQKRLKDALEELENLFWDLPTGELDQIKTPYNYMLHYMAKGMDDPQRHTLHTRLLKDTIELTDSVIVHRLDTLSNRLYHRKRRELLNRLNAISYQQILKQLETFNDDLAISNLVSNDEQLQQVFKLHEEGLKDLFHKTWLSTKWSAGEREEADLFFESQQILQSDILLFVSAVTLSLTHYFDPKKYCWLIHASQQDNVYIKARALVGLVIITTIHNQRLSHYSDLNTQLSFLLEDPAIQNLIKTINIQILQSQETEKIDRRMREEIIPEMMKQASSMKDMKFGFEENEDDTNDHNPDWQEAIENSELGDKIKEINELQMQGADIYMSTFSSLKGYPFFYSIENWFYPFEQNHSAVYKEFGTQIEKGSIADLILHSGLFCNNDKYSLCFTIQQIPESQRKMMLNKLTEQQMGGLEEEQKAMKLKEIQQNPDLVTNQYIHDLYRFFKLYTYRGEFKDPFNSRRPLYTLPQFEKVIKEPTALTQLAEFLMRNGRFEEAINTYRILIEKEEISAIMFQKKGYCHQKLKQHEEAIKAYIKADTLLPNNLWTNRHIATCYRVLQQYEKALEHYKAVEEVQPDNLSNLFYKGVCLTGLDRYEEALQCFFKLDFMKENSKRAWRAIAWCSFITDKLEQAQNYYSKVLENKPLGIDYLNAGHVAWANKDIPKAIELYSSALTSYKSKDEFIEQIEKDKKHLIKKGISEEDIPLIIDLI